ncbi:hypothetical protein BGW39_010730 [Mortierella sp. 14UC]|nr:hypothetical protein BGW39_010730 [Mortierella sp. 14UC]
MAKHSQEPHDLDLEANITSPLLPKYTPYNNCSSSNALVQNYTSSNTNTNPCHNNHSHERQIATPSSSYDPSTSPIEWMHMFETVARANNWSARTKLDIVPLYLQENLDTRTWCLRNQSHWETANANTTSTTTHANIDAAEDEDEKKFERFKAMFVARFQGGAAAYEQMWTTPSYPYHPYHKAADWLEMFEEVARANNWTPQTQLDVIPIYLQIDSGARKWFRQNRYQWESFSSGDDNSSSTCNDDDEDDTDDWKRFETFKRLFLDEFGSQSVEEAKSRRWITFLAVGILSLVLIVVITLLTK